MKTSRFSDSQILAILKQAENGNGYEPCGAVDLKFFISGCAPLFRLSWKNNLLY